MFWGGLSLGTVVGMAIATVSKVSDVCPKYAVEDDGVGFWIGVVITVVFWVAGLGIALKLGQSYNKEVLTGSMLWAILGWHGPDVVRDYVNKTSRPNFQLWDKDFEIR